MGFEMRQTGEIMGKPVYESVEEAFGRHVCEVAGMEFKKEPKVVKTVIPAMQKGGKPIETTIMKPCLPSPAFEICELAENLLSQECDISYRMGYVLGYKDKDEKKEMQSVPAMGNTPKTHEFSTSLNARVTQIPFPGLAPVVAIFVEALAVKRSQGYASGYWQGYNDRAGSVMPKFHFWDDPEKQAKQFEW